MREFNISNDSGAVSRVLVGERLSNVLRYIQTESLFVITDENLYKHYGACFPGTNHFVLPPGESAKSLRGLERIYRWLLNSGAHRKSFILGIGGGVVCDITGFVASTFMRGVEFGFVATSLLAQVDAAVGGKNGVNLHGVKNIIGTFSQPRFVICELSMLQTLPYSEFANGLAEAVKHTLIADEEMFAHFESNSERLKQRDPEMVEQLVAHSVGVKLSIVRADEREQGGRKLLNFGHTWGHAVEHVTGIPHGSAVSVGMEFAARFSMQYASLSELHYSRIVNLLKNLGLPTEMLSNNTAECLRVMRMDKKRNNDAIDFVLLNSIGEAVVKPVTIDELSRFVASTNKNM